MATCGLWPTNGGIVAVVADAEGAAASPAKMAARTAKAGGALLDHIQTHHGIDCRFVITDDALAADKRFGQLAARRGVKILVVSTALVDELRILTGFARSPPKKLALLLARLPLCGLLAEKLTPLRLQLELL
jgi:hypothetical protein